jgi:hypothetical protein
MAVEHFPIEVLNHPCKKIKRYLPLDSRKDESIARSSIAEATKAHHPWVKAWINRRTATMGCEGETIVGDAIRIGLRHFQSQGLGKIE